MAESCESVVSSAVTSVVPHGQTKVPETPCQEDAETSGSPADETTKTVVTSENTETQETNTRSTGDTAEESTKTTVASENAETQETNTRSNGDTGER